VDQGGANDTALLFLQRLNRLDVVSDAARTHKAVPNRSRGQRGEQSHAASPIRIWIATIAACVLIVGVVTVTALAVRSWLVELPVTAPIGEPAQAEALPIVRTSDTRMSHARDLVATGHPHDALAVLNDIDLADPLRAEADRLTADIQRGLLAGAGAAAVAASVRETRR
jgi:hypothetical protein